MKQVTETNTTIIDPKKLYEVEIIKVISTYRINYNRQGLQLFFHIKDLNRSTSRTLDIPESLRATSTVFRQTIGNIAGDILKEEMLDKPNMLAKEIASEVCNKQFYARLGLSLNGKYIDVLEVLKPVEVEK